MRMSVQDAGWGWSDSSKRAELNRASRWRSRQPRKNAHWGGIAVDPKTRYIFAVIDGQRAGYVSFQFLLAAELDTEPALYVCVSLIPCVRGATWRRARQWASLRGWGSQI